MLACCSRVRRDGENRDHAFVRPVTPEHAVGAGRPVLHVSLKHFTLWIVRMFERVILVRAQTGMPWIVAQELKRLVDLFE